MGSEGQNSPSRRSDYTARQMASSSPLQDMEKNFFRCSVCLDQLKDPKLLPCLHRYCSDCLKVVMQISDTETFKCPMCNQHHAIPANGVDGFKTDFHMKSMLEFIQLQKSFKEKEFKKCISCSQKKTVTAYCFKCKNFLCDPCYHFHIKNPMFIDHQPHTLNLESYEEQNLTLEKLAALTEDPRCHLHVKQQAQLCCCTCGNVPVCVTCTYSKHKGHDLHDVTELAKTEREALKFKMATLNEFDRKVSDLRNKLQSTSRRLRDNVASKSTQLTNQHKQQVNKIKYKIDENTSERERGLKDIETRRNYEICQIRNKREDELCQVREKYSVIIDDAGEIYDKETNKLRAKYDEIESALSRMLERLNDQMKGSHATKEEQTIHNETELTKLSDYCEQMIKRYENFRATATSILACNNEWTDAQCIPDIRRACEPLTEEIDRGFPGLESLSDVAMGDITKDIVDDVRLTELEETVVDVKGIQVKGWRNTSMTSTSDGEIVITGKLSRDRSHITVINKDGKTQMQKQVRREKNCGEYPHRYCSYLSDAIVVTVCKADEMGVFNVRSGSYEKKMISDVTNSWPADRCVTCICTDRATNRVIVGTNTRDLYVFDNQLNFSHIIKLPEEINHSVDIAVHRGKLLVCDADGMEAYAIFTKELNAKLLYKFVKPRLDGINWRPLRVCTDKNGFVYMVWTAFSSGLWRCLLLQYSENGQQLLTTRIVDGNARCLAILEIDGNEKLLITTVNSGKLYTYGLVVKSLINYDDATSKRPVTTDENYL
ncbi:uncharacterized protein [Apostichopus japonicus]|uniref:uncharacterized protein n=1 Tax=Stichopus japonicus TaxID=307972 RepID=UPI003AB59528